MPVGPALERKRWLGVDVGQVNDPTALLVLERRREWIAAAFDPATGLAAHWTPAVYSVSFLQRLPLGTSYPAVASRVGSVVASLKARPDASFAEVVVDVTGVGRPILQSLGAACRPRVGVNFTAGDRASVSSSGSGVWNVPKRDLVAGVVLLFQRGELRIADSLADGPLLVNELVNYRQRLSDAANATFGNDGKRSKHDDYVSALCIAVWRARLGEAGQLDGERSLGL
jgi:hypothetical protein